jgi:tRNA 2-thiouridine synthesizing protein A
MTIKIDARGLSCPQPVVLAQQAMEKNQSPIEVLVDTVTARENVARMSRHFGWTVAIQVLDDEFKLTLTQ